MSSEVYGCEQPRIFTPPLRELTPDTTLGFDIIDFSREVLHIEPHPWQKWFLIHAFEIIDLPDGTWRLRFRTIILLVGRQCGKTTLGTIIALYFLYQLGVALILGTAQDVANAEDIWALCVEMAQANPDLAEQIQHVWFTNGAKRLQLVGGRDYRVKAANRKAGRGKSADLVLLDELREHQTWDAYAALSKTGMARKNALLLCMSNAGDGTSVVLRHFRIRAHRMLGDPDGIVAALGDSETIADESSLEDTALGLFEWSAAPDMDIADPQAWAQGSPSLGYTIDFATMKAACADDPVDVFKTECLCQWVTAAVTPPFPIGAWESGQDAESSIASDSPLWWGVDVSDDRNRSSIAVCGLRDDGTYHVELVEYRSGVGWLQNWFAERAPKYHGMRVALQAKGSPVAAMADIIGAVDGVDIVPCQGADVAGWSGRLYDAVSACDANTDSDSTPVYHRVQPALDLAANIAVTRPLGDGAWAWDRRKSLEDISPLVAVTMAHGAATAVNTPMKYYESAYERHGVMVV